MPLFRVISAIFLQFDPRPPTRPHQVFTTSIFSGLKVLLNSRLPCRPIGLYRQKNPPIVGKPPEGLDCAPFSRLSLRFTQGLVRLHLTSSPSGGFLGRGGVLLAEQVTSSLFPLPFFCLFSGVLWGSPQFWSLFSTRARCYPVCSPWGPPASFPILPPVLGLRGSLRSPWWAAVPPAPPLRGSALRVRAVALCLAGLAGALA